MADWDSRDREAAVARGEDLAAKLRKTVREMLEGFSEGEVRGIFEEALNEALEDAETEARVRERYEREDVDRALEGRE